jgi:hypothetical protein
MTDQDFARGPSPEISEGPRTAAQPETALHRIGNLESGHTPGPWQLHPGDTWIHGAPGNAPLAMACKGIHRESHASDPSFVREVETRSLAEVQANARLIAVAPEMLTVLRSVANEPCRSAAFLKVDCEQWLMDHPSAGRCVRCDARALLAKVNGR